MVNRNCRSCGIEKELSIENFRLKKQKSGKCNFEFKCHPCRLATAKKWYLNNIEKNRARDANFAKNNPDLVKSWKKKYRDENKEASSKYRRNRYDKDIEKSRKEGRENAKKWREENREQSRINAKKGRAERKNRKDHKKITAIQVAELKEKQRGKCAICNNKLNIQHMDHIMPLAKGGVHEILNIQLLCPPCNQYKHDRHPIDHMQRIGYLL